MNDMIMVAIIAGVLSVIVVISYIVEAIFLAKIASNNGENPLLAWIPIMNYFLIRNIAGKKSRWQWLVAFLAASILGSAIVRWLGVNVLLWSAFIWYWAAFFKIADRKNISMALCMIAIFCIPIKWYVMYKMAE